MTVIAVVSMKGGVGKTSITANLAAVFAHRLPTRNISALDLDSQNALQWHFGRTDHDAPGICAQTVLRRPWLDIAFQSDEAVVVFPYGQATEPRRKQFETQLSLEPDCLLENLRQSNLGSESIVLIDTPPGSSVYLEQALVSADFALVVQQADAASYATLPAMQAYLQSFQEIRPDLKSAVLLNQVDYRDQLATDIRKYLQTQLGQQLVPQVVQADEAVREALAFQQPVVTYDPHGQASFEINRLAGWLLEQLQ